MFRQRQKGLGKRQGYGQYGGRDFAERKELTFY